MGRREIHGYGLHNNLGIAFLTGKVALSYVCLSLSQFLLQLSQKKMGCQFIMEEAESFIGVCAAHSYLALYSSNLIT
jgi:hypothetical protein